MINDTVNANPTKDFFIQMLTKDIKLERAIIDLIDNSVDGAKKIKGYEYFDDLWVKITISKTEFTIKDNCGGFSLDVAKNYAFMFGRPIGGDNEVKHSVGRFGVGMKRALFKIGKLFEVESKSGNDHFQVSVNVDEWSKNTDDWKFGYKMISQETDDLGDLDGTFIRVQSLNDDVTDEFESEIFLKNLKDEIERTLSFSIDRKLKIYLNNTELSKSGLSLLENNELKPFYKSFDVKGVNVKIYAGIGTASPENAGWYLYCNDRLVLEKDKTNLTGWEGRRMGESNIQKFHPIYAMFRGIVFFSSDDSKVLPMTTTKTGIDSNSTVYRAARHEMIIAMSQVFTFLKSLESDEKRNDIITLSEEVDVIQLRSKSYQDKFVYPTIDKISDVDSYTSISFKAEKAYVKKAQKFFGVSSNKEVGENIFNYFLKLESDNL